MSRSIAETGRTGPRTPRLYGIRSDAAAWQRNWPGRFWHCATARTPVLFRIVTQTQPLPVPTAPGLPQLRARLGRVCVSLAGNAMLDQAAMAGRDPGFVEFRLDSIAKPKDLLPALKTFLEANRLVVAIATCRRKVNGGGFNGSAKAQLEILAEAVRCGCLLADIEIESVEELGHAAQATLREAGAAVLISWHDYKSTPNLDTVYNRIAPFAPDYFKIVPTAKTLLDALRVIDLLEAHAEDANVVSMSMGARGVLTRILGPRFGSAFTFAAPDAEATTAPGQLPARTLLDLYRIDSIETSTRIYGVAGLPIDKSLSPLMQNTAFRRESVDAVLVPLDTADPKELQRVIDRLPLRGLCITMPLKQTIMPLLERSDPFTKRIGACNTVVRGGDGGLFGFNTDAAGITGPLERRIILRNARALVLGAGGAARAAVFGLRDRGVEVMILNRTTEKAQALAKASGAKVQRRDALLKSDFDILINATPYGMASSKMDAPIKPDEMRAKLFFDLVYNPTETPLIRTARARGMAVLTGAEMFVAQGARQFEIWTGRPAPLEDMLRVVTHALRANEPAAPQPPAAKTITPPATPPVVPVVTPVPEPPALRPVPAKVVAAPAKPVAPAKSVVNKAVPAVPAKKAVVPAKKAVVPAKKPVAPARQKPAIGKKTVATPARKAATKKAVPKKAVPIKKAVPAKKLTSKPKRR